MILKSHLCGMAVAYGSDNSEPYTGPRYDFPESSFSGRPQGSLYSQQKRSIADACEYLRLNSVFKPLIFVATSPGFTNLANEKSLIKKLTHNLRNSYECKNYVWVREFTKKGYPHFHFVADMPDVDVLALSRYWSGLFDSTAVNSVRLGTRPNKQGKRFYYLKGQRMAWYLTKYLGKSIGEGEKSSLGLRRNFRTFAISQELSKNSQPVYYQSMQSRTEIRKKNSYVIEVRNEHRQWVDADSEVICDDKLLSKWNWKYTGFANTFKGLPKSWKPKK